MQHLEMYAFAIKLAAIHNDIDFSTIRIAGNGGTLAAPTVDIKHPAKITIEVEDSQVDVWKSHVQEALQERREIRTTKDEVRYLATQGIDFNTKAVFTEEKDSQVIYYTTETIRREIEVARAACQTIEWNVATLKELQEKDEDLANKLWVTGTTKTLAEILEEGDGQTFSFKIQTAALDHYVRQQWVEVARTDEPIYEAISDQPAVVTTVLTRTNYESLKHRGITNQQLGINTAEPTFVEPAYGYGEATVTATVNAADMQTWIANKLYTPCYDHLAGVGLYLTEAEYGAISDAGYTNESLGFSARPNEFPCHIRVTKAAFDHWANSGLLTEERQATVHGLTDQQREDLGLPTDRHKYYEILPADISTAQAQAELGYITMQANPAYIPGPGPSTTNNSQTGDYELVGAETSVPSNIRPKHVTWADGQTEGPITNLRRGQVAIVTSGHTINPLYQEPSLARDESDAENGFPIASSSDRLLPSTDQTGTTKKRLFSRDEIILAKIIGNMRYAFTILGSVIFDNMLPLALYLGFGLSIPAVVKAVVANTITLNAIRLEYGPAMNLIYRVTVANTTPYFYFTELLAWLAGNMLEGTLLENTGPRPDDVTSITGRFYGSILCYTPIASNNFINDTYVTVPLPESEQIPVCFADNINSHDKFLKLHGLLAVFITSLWLANKPGFKSFLFFDVKNIITTIMLGLLSLALKGIILALRAVPNIPMFLINNLVKRPWDAMRGNDYAPLPYVPDFYQTVSNKIARANEIATPSLALVKANFACPLSSDATLTWLGGYKSISVQGTLRQFVTTARSKRKQTGEHGSGIDESILMAICDKKAEDPRFTEFFSGLSQCSKTLESLLKSAADTFHNDVNTGVSQQFERSQKDYIWRKFKKQLDGGVVKSVQRDVREEVIKGLAEERTIVKIAKTHPVLFAMFSLCATQQEANDLANKIFGRFYLLKTHFLTNPFGAWELSKNINMLCRLYGSNGTLNTAKIAQYQAVEKEYASIYLGDGVHFLNKIRPGRAPWALPSDFKTGVSFANPLYDMPPAIPALPDNYLEIKPGDPLYDDLREYAQEDSYMMVRPLGPQRGNDTYMSISPQQLCSITITDKDGKVLHQDDRVLHGHHLIELDLSTEETQEEAADEARNERPRAQTHRGCKIVLKGEDGQVIKTLQHLKPGEHEVIIPTQRDEPIAEADQPEPTPEARSSTDEIQPVEEPEQIPTPARISATELSAVGSELTNRHAANTVFLDIFSYDFMREVNAITEASLRPGEGNNPAGENYRVQVAMAQTYFVDPRKRTPDKAKFSIGSSEDMGELMLVVAYMEAYRRGQSDPTIKKYPYTDSEARRRAVIYQLLKLAENLPVTDIAGTEATIAECKAALQELKKPTETQIGNLVKALLKLPLDETEETEQHAKVREGIIELLMAYFSSYTTKPTQRMREAITLFFQLPAGTDTGRTAGMAVATNRRLTSSNT